MLKIIPFGRASFMLDAVTLAMFVVLPVLTWSIYLARKRHNYLLHKKVQYTTGAVLLIAVLAFEVEIRLRGWRHLAEPSPYYNTWLFPLLYVHLFFACSTTLLWAYTIYSAWKNIPHPPSPANAGHHKKFARWAALFMYITAITGWSFYWAAFIA